MRALSPKLRFEVFKRDNFTCKYCGGRTPNVVLEVDHVVPLSAGGEDTLANLVTACFQCNRGKGKTPLSEYAAVLDYHEEAVLALERQRQREEYDHVLSRLREIEDRALDALEDYWCSLWDSTQPNYMPWRSSMRSWLQFCSQYDVMSAMDTAADTTQTDRRAVKYLGGYMRQMKADLLEGLS